MCPVKKHQEYCFFLRCRDSLPLLPAVSDWCRVTSKYVEMLRLTENDEEWGRVMGEGH